MSNAAANAGVGGGGEELGSVESSRFEHGGCGISDRIWITSRIVGRSTACSSTHSIAT